LREACLVCANHQGTSSTTMPPANLLAVGKIIEAYESSAPTSDQYDLDTIVFAIAANPARFQTNTGLSMTLLVNEYSDTRTLGWGSLTTPTITCSFDINFRDEDHARWFFNSGGEIRVALYHPNGVGNNAQWHGALGGVGVLRFSHNQSITNGLPIQTRNIGYYQLTASQQIVFNANDLSNYTYVFPGGPQTGGPNDKLRIEAQRLGYLGVRGGNGSSIRFTVTMTENSPTVSPSISPGTKVSVDILHATGPVDVDPPETIVSQTLLNGGGG
jgi:hypothetical protein